MENKDNKNPSAQDSSAASLHRHEAAIDFTRELVEEIVSSAHTSSTSENKKK